MITLDFETMPIEARPDYPPEPVSVSIKPKGREPKFAHGRGTMREALDPIFKGKEELLFHNAAFDLAVAVEKLGLPLPNWRRIHDTKFLLFLNSPYESLSLKPACASLLGIGEEDQDELREWIQENIRGARKLKTKWGKYIGYAPIDLIRKRAHGDTIRTELLFDHLYPIVKAKGMLPAYDRERRLLPMLIKNSKGGVRVDRALIIRDREIMEDALVKCDNLIRTKLCSKDLNPGSPKELIKAIDKRKMGGNWQLTPGGAPSASKNSLLQGVTNKELLSLLQYRSKAETALTTFLRNWHDTIARTFDHLHTEWNQVKGEGVGAATGRKSSSPNFQNIPKLLKADDLLLVGLPAIPKFRYYFLPDPDEVWLRRDFSQQELRILAHMAGGNLRQMYLDNPTIDFHQHAADNMAHLDLMRPEVQVKVNRYDDPRGIAKMIAFSLLYGMGLDELAYRLGISRTEAQNVRNAYLELFPGLKDLQDELKFRAKIGDPIHTWGGREYYCQPPKWDHEEQRMRKFDYKLLNYLIQGSAADCTKEALCRLHEANLPGRFLLDVHDEISWSLPGNKKNQCELAVEIGRIMKGIEFDVPMLSDAEVGPSWGNLRKELTWQ